MSSRAIRFSTFAPNRGLQIATGAVTGLSSALRTAADMHMRKMQLDAMKSRNDSMGAYYKARAAAYARQNMSADTSRVQFAHDYANYLKGQGNPDAAKSVLKAAQPLVDKVVQGMPVDQANQYRQKIQDEVMNRQPLEPEMSSLNPAEQKIYGQTMTADTRKAVADTSAGARVDSAREYGATRSYVADKALQGRQYSADASVRRTDMAGQYKNHADAMSDVTKQINQTAKALSPNNPFSQGLDPEAKDHLQKRMDDLQNQYVQLSTMDPKSFGKTQPVAGAQGGSTAPGKAGPNQPPAQKPMSFEDNHSTAPVGATLVTADGRQFTKQQNGFIPVPSPTPSAPPAPAAPVAPPMPAPAPAAEPSPSGS